MKLNLSKQITKLLYSFLAIYLILSVAVFYLFKIYFERQQIALNETVLFTQENNIRNRDFREFLVATDKLIPKVFLRIEIRDKEGSLLLSAPSLKNDINGDIFVKSICSLTQDKSMVCFFGSYASLLKYWVISTSLIMLLLGLLFLLQRKNLIRKLNEEVKAEAMAKQFDLAQKLAHDIRSPISTLNLISANMQNEELKELQKNVVFQINKIADDLLDNSKNTGNLYLSASAHNLILLLKNLEKEYRLKSSVIKPQIKFEINQNEVFEINCSKNLIEGLYPIINNLIQNSVEACDENGLILIGLRQLKASSVELYVEDNGRGIKPEILKILGSKKVSFADNKSTTGSGNGVAFFNAQKFLTQFNKKLLIKTIENKGTKISLVL